MSKIPAVLLVDDDPTTNFLHQKLMQRLGVAAAIRVALNGQEALHEVQQSADRPLLVLLDLNMPVMNGLQFLEAYQQLPAAQQQGVILVMVTSSATPRDQQRARELPIADYLDKPLTQQQVERILMQHFT